jgi:UDP-GlcNAc:undecaprenyl-phosphate GlcNAc-1-phosphate transferase
MTTALLVFGLAILFGAAAIAAARAASLRLGFCDVPDGRRKLHVTPVAVCGGVGVLAGAVLALIVSAIAVPDLADELTAAPARLVSLAVAACVIAAVGVIDDLVSLRARHKLLGQTAAALVLIVPGGYVIERLTVLGLHVELGSLAIPATLLWFLAAINAINLLDGMDGLLGTVGVIIFGSLAVMALGLGNTLSGYVAVAAAGALVGFLVFNLPPATVYLGDCGSMLIGLVVAALAISSSLKGTAVAVVAPAALLVLPILDTTAAIVRRKLTGRGVAIADRGHFHHEMQRRYANRWLVLAAAAFLGLIGAAGALAGTFLSNDFYAIGAAAAVVLVLGVTGWFGLAELRLIRSRAGATIRNVRGRRGAVEAAVQLQGSADWRDFWRGLVGRAELLEVTSLRLDVNAPAWHESFHGRWDRHGDPDAAGDSWRAEVPVAVRGAVVGKMSLVGSARAVSMVEQLSQMAAALPEVERVLLPLPRLHPNPARTVRAAGPARPAPLPASA